jgi:hypothetical protein
VFCCTILYLCEYIHMSYSKLYSCLRQAQDYYHYIVILEDQSFPITWPSQSNAYLVLFTLLNYSTCKCVNWVVQTFLKPSLVPKCDICYLKNKCCYTYSNSIVVALSHTYVIYFTWAIPKLIHALVKHKDFINYIMPNPIFSQIHIDLPQLSSQIHISQFIFPLPYLLVITSQ